MSEGTLRLPILFKTDSLTVLSNKRHNMYWKDMIIPRAFVRKLHLLAQHANIHSSRVKMLAIHYLVLISTAELQRREKKRPHKKTNTHFTVHIGTQN